MAFDLDGYVTVPERITSFYAANPEGRIACTPPAVLTIGDRLFIASTAYVYRTPDDPTPSVGSAWEPYPGRTPYTKDSEAMNAETSAVGRALGLAGYGVGKSVATREDVRSEPPAPPQHLTRLGEAFKAHAIHDRAAVITTVLGEAKPSADITPEDVDAILAYLSS